MKIAIDLRSLSGSRISGVENYCLNLLENLPPKDLQNQYIFFYNSLRKRKLADFHYVNSQIKDSGVPSKFLNLILKLNLMKLESIIGQVDWVFMPNLNQFSINPKTKLAITVHDLSPLLTSEFYDFKRRLWHKFLNYKKAFHRANVLFAVSKHTKHALIKVFQLPEQKIQVIYPGVDTKSFHPNISQAQQREIRNIYGLPGEFFLFLNTIEPRKNLANLIKAFEALSGKAWLVVAGRQGWKYKKVFQLIAKSKKREKIKYIGYIPEVHKPGLIKLAKALVYPSFYEGFGFQPLEAMAVGTPVVASQLTAIPEVVADAGLLINPYDVNSLTRALQEISVNTALRVMLVNKGFERVEKFNWQETARQIMQSFYKL